MAPLFSEATQLWREIIKAVAVQFTGGGVGHGLYTCAHMEYVWTSETNKADHRYKEVMTMILNL